MKLFITGATGFVGSVLIPALLKDSEIKSISALVLPGEKIPAVLLNSKVEIIYGNITDPKAMDKSILNKTQVIHLAGLISYNSKDKHKLYQVNCLGTQNIVNACLKHQIKRLVHISSVGAVGFNKNGKPADEDTPYNWPKCFYYMSTKYQGQKIVEKAVEESKLDAVILNPASIMGPGDQNITTPQNQILNRLYNTTIIGSFAGGLAVVDVRDLVNIILKSLKKPKFKYKNYLISGNNQTYQHTLRILGKYADRKVYPYKVPPIVLMGIGGLVEFIANLFKKTPMITYSYGRLSGWLGYYSNKRSIEEFSSTYIDFDKTARDACEFFERTFQQK